MSEVDKSTQPNKGSKPKAKKPSRSQLRSASRSFALQAVYQWHMNRTPINEIEVQFAVDHDLGTCDKVYFRELIQGVTVRANKLDDLFETLLDRSLSELDPIELTILRIGSFELSERLDVPYRVVINEGVELAKSFGATESHKYVNGILDKLSQRVRREEIAARRER
ncbi:transcription antitermination factor NusB [Marinomonas sp. 2405UD68-3]|uniref:transcription antitermination factor NusB n=1 Tax=Marinomonas sp. 2405UD68-3 TaxID=3391835 RepID=UPI0039C8F775